MPKSPFDYRHKPLVQREWEVMEFFWRFYFWKAIEWQDCERSEKFYN